MKSKVTDEQFTRMLKEQEADEKTANLCQRSGISQGTFYQYKSTYGGMEPANAKRLKALKKENARLKKLLSDQILQRDLVRQ